MKRTNVNFRQLVPAVLSAAAMGAALLHGQFGGGAPGDWPTVRMDAQRTGWMRTDPYISKEVMAKAEGFDLQWKTALANGTRTQGGLVAAVASGGRVPLTWVAGSTNIVHAVDTDTGVVAWSRKFDVPLPASTSIVCPGGLTAGVTKASTALVPPAGVAARGTGFGAAVRPAPRGGIGQPGEGVPVEFLGRARGAAPGDAAGRGAADPAAGRGRAATAAPAAAAGRAAAPGGGGRGGAVLSGAVTVTSDGVLHVLGDNTGIDVQKPVPFLPANAKATGLIGVNGVYYAATSDGCGGAPSGVWALDWNSDAKTVTSWTNAGGSPIGAPAFTTAGTLFVALGRGTTAGTGLSNAIVALEPKTLALKDWFTVPDADFASSPTIINFQDRELVAATTRDGRIFLLDTASLGGSDHKTPLYVSRAFSSVQTTFVPSGITFWQDGDNTRWILLPVAGRPTDVPLPATNGAVTNGAILALKLVDEAGRPSLQPSWISGDMTTPWAPVVINGVIFALSSGEYRPPQANAVSVNPQQRTSRSVPAVLHALDATTGRPLWSSARKMTVYAPAGALWVANSQILIAGVDNTVYSFGFPVAKW